MIKKHKNRNEYYYAGHGLWVRNFTKKLVQPVDINNLVPVEDMRVLLENELENHKLSLQSIDTESFSHPKIVIVNNGYQFQKKQHLLEQLNGDVIFIGTNDTIDRWEVNRYMNYYVVNNPYPDCMRYLSKRQRAWPRCITSRRTYPEFVQKYSQLNMVYEYTPVPDQHYSGLPAETEYMIDDYRNPICAAVCLAYHFGVKDLLLFCCDDSFADKRPGSQVLPNGLHTYPQQHVAHSLIDGNLYWLTTTGCRVASHSSGPEYKHAPYIADAYLKRFFEEA